MERELAPKPETETPRVLLVDNDPGIQDLVQAVLTDEGYDVHTLAETEHEAIAAAVGRIEPDAILLDGAHGPGFGDSWGSAAYLAERARPVPTVMFTAHAKAVNEARDGTTERALAARFAAVVPKPFLVDELIAAVDTAAGRSQRFDRSELGEHRRTSELVEELRAAGATDIRTGDRREWATFMPPDASRIHQLYWWQRKGVYMVGRYDDEARLELIGQYFERDAAITAAMEAAASA